MKKLVTMLALCLIFVFCAVGFTACEDDGVNDLNNSVVDDKDKNNGNVIDNNPTVVLQPTADEYFTFTLLENDTYEIKAKNVNNMPETVVIPSTHNGKAVTSIGEDAFDGCSCLTSITIPDTIIDIGKEAFDECISLKSISFGKKSRLTSIGNEVFDNCANLESIIIPDSVISIGARAFDDCVNLASITIGNGITSIGENAFSDCSNLKIITFREYSKLSSIRDRLFANLICLETITLPDSIISIGERAFDACINLKSITFGENSKLEIIDEDAFRECISLTSVTIGNSVTSIGEDAFHECSSLTTVYYKGTAEDWNNISIDNTYNDNSCLINATRYYYSKSAPTTTGNYWHYDTDGVTPVVWE